MRKRAHKKRIVDSQLCLTSPLLATAMLLLRVRTLLLTTLLFVGGGIAGATTSSKSSQNKFQPVFNKARSSLKVATAIPRGGAGPLDTDLVANTAAVVNLANGAFMYLAPSQIPQVYKFPANPANVYVTE
jgi:hypothetical protein